jgi:hypothetical protein
MLRIIVPFLCAAGVSHAALFINGVRVDGIANVKLHNVDLEIDAQGDVHVTAKGYVVNVGESKTTPRTTPPPPNAKGPAQPTRYYLTMAQNGDPQWDVDVYLNGTYVRRFSAGRGSEPQTAPIEVTRMIKTGENSLRFHAIKQEGQVRSIEPSELISLTLDADQALVTGRHELTHIYSYKRTAAETGMFDESVSVTIR